MLSTALSTLSCRGALMQHIDYEALKKVKGFINQTESFGAVDGPGIRFVFFLQGCHLRCVYCHNPDSIPTNCGQVWTAEQALEEVLRYRSFIASGGVTLSGGEPLLQAEFVYALSMLLRREGIHVALDTAGMLPLTHTKNAIDAVDLVLLDIKGANDETTTRITGQGNGNEFLTLEYCEQTKKTVWIRHVLLRGYTLDDDQLESLALQLKPYHCIERIELLPFHKLGEPKWDELGWNYTLRDVAATTKEETDHAKGIFARHGFLVQ